ncbi:MULTISPECIES: pantothenate kinase [Pseudomonas]|jgi:type III pantothenate kinase|uniref:Type III pantothenate kinase n=2 Tax=Pseudomonas TaxID=286 RepID=A0A1L7N6H5_PSEPU|nr:MULTISPECIES: pantothenate kinase [Pseudomonas]PNB59865.1 pantothenate kinase [Pseudomonas sp. FW305-130]PTC00403.1 pantothenate kinase [Thalassospira xiamenensis]AGN77545.1 pantothenate kinase [Pseudomonas putida H8234]EKT4454094.1 pantothenate kinase [Pseudomonas putida]EKT4564351.1 pantothenate kinase [Pseudomonas putida]
MILELDCGNSFIKWRVIHTADAVIEGGGIVDSDQALLAEVAALASVRLTGCRIVSVRSEEETDALCALIAQAFTVQAHVAHPAQRMAGVRNGYDDYQRLGMDRWLAALGAFHLAKGACLVIDLGTAAKADFVAADGEHLGGYICPGMPLMRSQLRTHTRRIRYDDDSAERALTSLSPGRSTVEAVERGCVLMLQGFARTQLEQARALWGDEFTVFLTGGDAPLVREAVPQARVVPDLVFVGLAMACPLD